jgi:diguanylate cyclase (GGDEF)-like protein
MEAPWNADDVERWVNTRLRRAREAVRPARRDVVTGLPNRAAFCESFENALAESKRTSEPLTLAVLALDGTGDALNAAPPAVRNEIMLAAGSLLSATLRATDILARWGTYEFVMLFPGEDPAGGSRAVEKVLEKLRKRPLRGADGTTARLTVSAGVALVASDDTLESAIAKADRHVCQATATGDDCVVSDQSALPAGRVERVLVLVHDPTTANILRTIFEKDGFAVTVLHKPGALYSSQFERQRFHLMIIDEELPDGSGLAVLKEVRRHARYTRLPIVMLLARNAEQSAVKALELGASDYVMRPLSPFTFVGRVRRLLTRGGPDGGGAPFACRLLVADDDVKSLLMAASALQQKGVFTIYLAKGFQDACKRVAEERPDAVVLNVNMAGARGTDAVRAIRAAAASGKILIVAVTPTVDAAWGALLSAGDLAGIIDQPFNSVTLGDTIERLVGIPPGVRRVKPTADHLNGEIQRVLAAAVKEKIK